MFICAYISLYMASESMCVCVLHSYFCLLLHKSVYLCLPITHLYHSLFYLSIYLSNYFCLYKTRLCHYFCIFSVCLYSIYGYSFLSVCVSINRILLYFFLSLRLYNGLYISTISIILSIASLSIHQSIPVRWLVGQVV